MYLAHFGLKEAPFRITPNTDVFFSGGNRGAILEALLYALSQGEGIVKVTGEVGSGKTMLCNMLQARLPATVETVYLAHPSVSPEEILHAIAFEMQLPVPRDAGRMEVMQALYAHLLERHAEGRQVVIFVEESQNMPLATLEEIRLLSNLETGRHKLLQIVLFGQPELDENLRQPQIRQLRERITHSFMLQPLLPHEVGAYLMFRLRAAGYHGPDLFGPRVVKLIAQASLGLSRRINLIADKTLLAAFSENTHSVRPRHVQAAIRDSEFARDMPAVRRPAYGVAAAMLAAGVAIGAGALYFWQSQTRDATLPIATTATGSAHAPAAGAAPPAPQVSQTPAPPSGAEAQTSGRVTGPEPAPDGVTAAAASPAPAASVPPAPETAPAPPAAVSVAGSVARTVPAPGPDTPVVASVQQPAATAAPVEKPVATRRLETPPDPPPKGGARGTDTLESRLQATTQWLRTEKEDTFTIQLLGAENPQQLREHLNIIAKFVEINNIFVYRTTAKQKPYLTVLYGSYDSREAAQEALTRLPAQLRAFRPYLRTVQGVRSEIGQRDAAPSS